MRITALDVADDEIEAEFTDQNFYLHTHRSIYEFEPSVLANWCRQIIEHIERQEKSIEEFQGNELPIARKTYRGNDESAVDALASALQHAWDDHTGDCGEVPDEFELQGHNALLAMDFRKGGFVDFAVSWLKAHGYQLAPSSSVVLDEVEANELVNDQWIYQQTIEGRIVISRYPDYYKGDKVYIPRDES